MSCDDCGRFCLGCVCRQFAARFSLFFCFNHRLPIAGHIFVWFENCNYDLYMEFNVKGATVADDEQSLLLNSRLIQQANTYFSAMESFRRRRQRAVDFYRGRQWCDVVNVNGRILTEEQYIEMQGRPALKQNMIRPQLRNLIGQYRHNPSKPMVYARNRDAQQAAEMMTAALESVLDMNDWRNRDARQLEEFLISGCAVYKTAFAVDDEAGKAVPQFVAVNPNRFFLNTDHEELQNDDVDFVGEVADMSFEQLVAVYAHNRADEQRLRLVYGEDGGAETEATVAADNLRRLSLLQSVPSGKCRVIEVWSKTHQWQLVCHDPIDGSCYCLPADRRADIERQNRLRAMHMPPIEQIEVGQKFATVWNCRHVSPSGHTLFSGPSPYAHGSHPYVFLFYPMLDGECWGLVEDLIDQQKMINRNMIMFDFVNGASAKGVLLVPEECIPEDYSIEDIAEEWSRYNGVIKIKTRAGAQIPQQISNGAVHGGLLEMIRMQIGLMADIGGVHGAAQGKESVSGTPSSLYAQQSQNSAVNTLDYIASFNDFIRLRDRRLVQIIRQFFTAKQYVRTYGDNSAHSVSVYDPDVIRGVDFDNAIIQSTDTPAFRALMDDTLMRLFQSNAISLRTYLENSSLPYADRILAGLDADAARADEGV